MLYIIIIIIIIIRKIFIIRSFGMSNRFLKLIPISIEIQLFFSVDKRVMFELL